MRVGWSHTKSDLMSAVSNLTLDYFCCQLGSCITTGKNHNITLIPFCYMAKHRLRHRQDRHTLHTSSTINEWMDVFGNDYSASASLCHTSVEPSPFIFSLAKIQTHFKR